MLKRQQPSVTGEMIFVARALCALSRNILSFINVFIETFALYAAAVT